MRKDQFTFDEALSFVKSIRPIVQPNSAFEIQLRALESKLLGGRELDLTEVTAIGPALPLQRPETETERHTETQRERQDEIETRPTTIATEMTTLVLAAETKRRIEIEREQTETETETERDNDVQEDEPVMKRARTES